VVEPVDVALALVVGSEISNSVNPEVAGGKLGHCPLQGLSCDFIGLGMCIPSFQLIATRRSTIPA
jgi:hypothetical protein